MGRDLSADQELLRSVLQYAQNRDIARAAALAERALAEGFEHPLLLNVLATRREEEGRLQEALLLLERAVALAPEDVPARNALALCLQRLERPAEALQHLDELLKRNPDVAFAHANRGNSLIALGMLGAARTSHLRALELDPHNFVAMAALASIATHRGQHAEARQWAERVLARVPGFPDAVLSLSAAELAGGDATGAESHLRALLADARAGTLDRARAQGLLGDVLDLQGQYGAAFEAYRACNLALLEVHRRFAAGTSILAHTRALSATLAALGPRWPASAGRADTSGAAGHAFLLGFPRSGTTLLEVALEGHPQIVALEEHELLTESVHAYLGDAAGLERLARAGEPELEPLRGQYWARVRRGGADVAGKVFIDKHPLNTLKLPLIARLFPGARILFACRDPRDVVLSCFRRRFQMNPAMYQLLTLEGTAQFYDAVMELAEGARRWLPLQWHEVRYEQLMADFTASLHSLCTLLGLEPTENLGAVAERVAGRERATPSSAQLSRGLDPSGIGAWKNYRVQLTPVLPLLARWIERFGAAPQA